MKRIACPATGPNLLSFTGKNAPGGCALAGLRIFPDVELSR
jgi:hypothetical protein